MIKLYTYFRSTAAYRVRIALHYKQLEHELLYVNLIKDGGEQHKSEYKILNPQGLVPTLIDNDLTLSQSMAILEYLEEAYPKNKILPDDIHLRAKIRAFANIIACDTHPLNNLGVLQYLKNTLKVSDDEKLAWYHNWLEKNFIALEQILQSNNSNGKFCFNSEFSMADLLLIPQVYNANRFNFSLQAFPLISSINDNCLTLPFIAVCTPEKQKDYNG